MIDANSLNPIVDSDGVYELTVTNTINGCISTDDVAIARDTVAPVLPDLNQIHSPVDC